MTPANEPVTTSPLPKLSAFPNPTNGLLHVEWQDKAAAKSTANLFGNQTQRIRIGLPFVNGKLDIDLSELPSGIYHLTFSGPSPLDPLTVVKY